MQVMYQYLSYVFLQFRTVSKVLATSDHTVFLSMAVCQMSNNVCINLEKNDSLIGSYPMKIIYNNLN